MAASSSSSASSDSVADHRHEATLIYDQIYLSVQRSMCLLHFSGFDSLHSNLKNVCLIAVNASSLNQDRLSNYFPHPPEKVRREDWVHFDNWLRAGGEPLQNLCFDWSIYGLFTIWTCTTCKTKSSTLGWDTDSEEDLYGDEENGGHNGNNAVADEVIVIDDDDDEPQANAAHQAAPPAGAPGDVNVQAGDDQLLEEQAVELEDFGPSKSYEEEARRKTKKPRI